MARRSVDLLIPEVVRVMVVSAGNSEGLMRRFDGGIEPRIVVAANARDINCAARVTRWNFMAVVVSG